MGTFLNLRSRTFGSLKVIRPTNKKENGSIIWLCKCKCGNLHKISSRKLMSGFAYSCGCSNKNEKHNKTNTTEYISWSAMKKRCYNKNDPQYKDYGGRGIKV